MKAGPLAFRESWTAALGALGLLSTVSCASAPPPAPAELSAWSGFDDCFQRAVSVPAGDAERMARTCSGDAAAGDPSRSGIARANAYFNAASAYNVLAAAGTSNALCQTGGACSLAALDLVEKSLASQQDNQIRPADDAQNTINERFVLRRKLALSRALHGVAASGVAGASCGTATACLTDASQMLGAINVEPSLASDDAQAVSLGCELLDVRWRVNSDLGRENEYKYVDDLRRIVQACPANAAAASDRLAEISFERAERVREALAVSDPPPSVEAALGAITDYRDALSAGEYKLPAYRGMGAVYRALATLAPASSQTYLTDATEALDSAVTLGAASEPSAARAADLEALGTSLIDLAHVTGRPGSAERLALFERAASALQDAVNLSPTPARYALLGEAYGETGQYAESIAAYQAAIAGLSGPEKIDATLALAGIYDQSGNPAAALTTLNQASAQGASSAEVQYEIGRREFVAGNLGAALTALQPAAGALSGMRAAEANYMMSVAEVALKPEGWQRSAQTHAERAVSLNARTWEYNRQACLTNILRGGRAVKEGTSLQRCPDEDTPEARLLRGMYFLKQAQSLDVSAYNLASQTQWRSVLRSAEEAFAAGQAALQDAREAERTAWFDDLQAEVDLATRLQQGLTVVQRCNREITLEPGDPAWKDLDAFFGYYGVLKCS